MMGVGDIYIRNSNELFCEKYIVIIVYVDEKKILIRKRRNIDIAGFESAASIADFSYYFDEVL